MKLFKGLRLGKLNSSGFSHFIGLMLFVVIAGVGGTYYMVSSRAAASLANTGHLAVSTFLKNGTTQQPIGGVLITPDNVGVTNECPRAPSKTDQTKGPNYGKILYSNCPVAIQSTNNYAKQYDVTATIPAGYRIDPSYATSTGARVNGNLVTRRVTLQRNVTTSVSFVLASNTPTVVGNIKNTASRNRIGGGAWITNIPDGYYMGKVYDGWRIDINKQSAKGFTFGAITRPDGTKYGCAWVEPGIVVRDTSVIDRSCDGKDIPLQNRDTIGKGYNCADHVCVDGAYTNLVAGCDARFYYNYQGGRLVDPAGVQPGGVFYRFTTLDGKLAVVRSKQLGWGYMSKSCINGYPQGGALKR